MRRAGTAHSTVPAVRGRAEVAPRAASDGAPVTVRHGTGREPRAPACSVAHTRGIDLRRALVVIKWVYTARSFSPRPRNQAGGFLPSRTLPLPPGSGGDRAFGRAALMRFRILGPLEVWSDKEGWAAIGAPKWRSLLACLLVRPGQQIGRA